MKKSVLLSLLGLSLITVVGLALLVGAPKPVQYTWKAVILDSSQNLTKGTGGVYDSDDHGWVYKDSDEFANVTIGIRTYVATKFKTTTYEPVLALEVLSPTQIGLQNFAIGNSHSNPDLIPCGFPDQGNFPSCWNTFLNQFHPQAGYQKAQLLHYGDRSMTKEEADITTMEPEDIRVMHLSLLLQGQDIYGASCDECDLFNYHQVDGNAHGYWKAEIGYYDIYLTRIDENKWKVVVNTEFDNPDRQDHFLDDEFYWGIDSPDRIWESYCECVYEKVGKRNVLTRNIRKSSWVRAPISYQMLFIRTPK